MIMPSPRQNAFNAATRMRASAEPRLVARSVTLGGIDESGRVEATDSKGNSLALQRLTPFALPSGQAVPAAIGRQQSWVDA